MAVPQLFERRDIDDDSAARIGGFAQANGQYIFWYAEVLNRARQGERVRRDNAHIVFDIDKAFGIKGLGIHRRRVNIREHFELWSTTNVITIARSAVGNYFITILVTHLARFKGVNHPGFSLFNNPAIRRYGHSVFSSECSNSAAAIDAC